MRVVLIVMMLAGSLIAQGSEWKPVKSWTGTGTKQTETFAVAAAEWRIRWTLKSPPNTPFVFSIMVFDDKDGLASSASAKQDDVTYVRGAGRFYVKVSAANVDWTVTVEEPQK